MAVQELTIYEYWKIIRKRKYLLIFSVISMLVITYFFTKMQKPLYKAFTQVKVILYNPKNNMLNFDPMAAEVRIIKSREVVNAAVIRLNSTDSASEIQDQIECDQIGGGNVIQISVYADSPEKVVSLANTITEIYIQKSMEDKNRTASEQKKYISAQLEQQEKELNRGEEDLRKFKSKGGASGLATAYASKLIDLNSDLSLLLKSYTEEHPEVIKKRNEIKFVEDQVKTLSEQDLTLIRLMREISISETLYSNLKKRFQEAEIDEAGKISVATIITGAVSPKRPVKPNMRLNLIIGGFLGFVIGSVVLLLLEGLDTSIANVEELEIFMEVPVLGIIPYASEEIKKGKGLFRFFPAKTDNVKFFKNNFALWHSKRSALVEAYHTLKTNVFFNISKSKKKTLIFTSSGPEEGKTFNAINFCLSVAESGLKVVLVESDLRRPTMHKIFGLKREDGLTDILLDNIPWQDGLKGTSDLLVGGAKMDDIIKIPGIENLKIITCGHTYANAIDLINSTNMNRLIENLKTEFDLVVFDCPPVLLFADATILASKVDGCILVYKAGRTSRIALKRTKTQLDNVKANIIGLVLNQVKMQMMPHYGSYYYSSRYYKDDIKDPQNE